jgi:peptide/nickel transport system substrate-binding protein
MSDQNSPKPNRDTTSVSDILVMSGALGASVTRRQLLKHGTRFAAFGAVLSTASLGLIACGEDDDEPDDVGVVPDDDDEDEDVETPEPDDEPDDEDDEDEDEPTDEPDTGDVQTGGTLTVVRSSDPLNLLPGTTTGLADIATNFLLYDALLIHGFDGEPYPALAREWEANGGGTEWTFHLRDDVTFHSGEPFNAAHVVDHFQRWKDRPTSAKIVLLDEIEEVDEYTVVCRLSSPTLVFLTMISQTEWAYGGIPNMHKVEELGDDYGVVEIDGTGPYKLEEWIKDDHITLARNEDYTWGPEFYENTGPVYPDRLVFQVVPEEASRSAMVETGQAHLNIEVSPRDVSRLEDTAGVTVESFSRVSSNHIGFNMEKDLFQDINLRRAVMHGINREEITEFIMLGQADPAEGYLHPAMLGAAPREQTRPLVEYDPERSIALLEESGWEEGGDGIRQRNGQRLEFAVYLTTELNEQINQAAQAHLREIGIDMQIRRLEGAGFNDATQAGEHDARFIPMIYSSEDHMYFFISDSIPAPNTLRWRDEEYDELFTISQTTTDEDERIDAFQRMELRMLEEAVVVPIQHLRWIFAWQDNVHGTTFHHIHGIYKMMDFWVES